MASLTTRRRHPHAKCPVCRQVVPVDHVSSRGDLFIIWHRSAQAARCPGTDKPALPVSTSAPAARRRPNRRAA